MGALRDYDESSFRHFMGVHVGRKALNQAADRLRQQRGVVGRGGDQGAREVPAAAATGGRGEGGGGGGGREEEEGEVAASPGPWEDAQSAGGAKITNSYEPVEKAKVHGGKGEGNGESEADVGDSTAPDGGVAGRQTGAVHGQEAELVGGTRDGAGGGGAVLVSRPTLPAR